MKAKDTVMSPEDLVPYLSTTDLYSAMCVDYEKAFGRQAEISFKAGEQTSDKKWRQILKDAVVLAKMTGIRKVTEPSEELLEIGRKAIEDVLIEWRDSRLSEFTRGNGLVIREKDGTDSSMIRFGPETALRIGLKAMGQAQKKVWGI